MAVDRFDEVKIFGAEHPAEERRLLEFGPVSAVLEGCDLRYIKVGDTEVIRRIYVATRDRNWGTLDNEIEEFSLRDSEGGFTARITVRNSSEEIDFHWTATITGASDGTLQYEFRGTALRDFEKNRIGFCILHPAAAAGRRCRFAEVDASSLWRDSRLPEAISRHQPFKNLARFAHEASDGLWANIDFDGDIFEMEDQRNWTDASFKIYCTPLELPFPVAVRKGEEIAQRVTLSFEGAKRQKRARSDAAIVRIGGRSGRRLVGTGFTINEPVRSSAQSPSLRGADVAAARRLHADHVRIDLYPAFEEWQEVLGRAAATAEELGCPLWVAVNGEAGAFPRGFAGEVERHAGIIDRILLASGQRPWVGSGAQIGALRRALSEKTEVSIGIGTSAWFTELNRTPPAAGDADFVFWSITPQVHAFDDRSLIETLSCQATTVESARMTFPDKESCVGPVTLRMRFNPNATTNESPLEASRGDEAADPRQRGLFHALFCLLTLRYLSQGGAARATFGELVGPRGMSYRRERLAQPPYDGRDDSPVFPTFHVFRELGRLTGAGLLDLESTSELEVDGLAIEHAGRRHLYLANLSADERTVDLEVAPCRIVEASVLDVDAWSVATDGTADAFGRATRAGEPLPGMTCAGTFVLPAWSLTRIVAEPQGA